MEKIRLINTETPLYKMQYTCGDTTIWIKRDDLLEFAFGGNKVRLYEYISAVIQNKSVERVVTYGSEYSNYLRVTAAVCARLGIECDLIVLKEDNCIEGGNAILLMQYEPRIIPCELSKAHSFIDEYQNELKKKKINYVWLPGGGHMPEAAFGYVDASEEILKQAKQNHVDFDAIFLPCGTGTSQAGLIYGMENKVDIYGVSIARTAEKCKNVINDLLKDMLKLDGNVVREMGKINVLFDSKSKYGLITDEIKQIAKKVAWTDGIFLDPIYNAKAFAGMIEFLKMSDGMNLKNVLYINTGGQPNIFMRGN